MDKYIVEIDGKNICSDADGKSKLALSFKADNGYAVFCTEIPLTPYIEPDLEQVRKKAYDKAYADAVCNCSEGCSHVKQVRKEAYDKCMNEAEDLAYKLYSPKIDEAYQHGLNDAWDTVRKMRDMTFNEQREVFGTDYYTDIIALSASECIEKIRQYEQKQEESEESKKEQSVTAEEVMRQYLDMFCTHSGGCKGCLLHTSDFTCGRGYHFLTNKPVSDEEVRRAYAEVLQKMKEN